MDSLAPYFERGVKKVIVAAPVKDEEAVNIAFCIFFAQNSSVHSYLILAYSEGDKVALNVGLYYMANAGGRLIGTLLSGLIYQAAGLNGSLWTSELFAAIAGAISLKLPRDRTAVDIEAVKGRADRE